MSACPYQILQDELGYYIVRPVLHGGHFAVAGPYNTRYEAETEARRRWTRGGRLAA